MRTWLTAALAALVLMPSALPVDAASTSESIGGTVLVGSLGLAAGAAAYRATGVDGAQPGFGVRVYADTATLRIHVPPTKTCPGTNSPSCGELHAEFTARDETGIGGVGPVRIGDFGIGRVPAVTGAVTVRTLSGTIIAETGPGEHGTTSAIVPTGTYDVVFEGRTGAAIRFALIATAA